jgi:dethiobiotin synthetase
VSALFVTGTDTGVGKTVVTAALAVVYRTVVRTPYVIKPAQTGVAPGDPGDLEVVHHLAGGVAGHEGARLRHPLAPETAARLEGVELPSLAEQHKAVVDAAKHHDVLVEGAGGVLVNLGDDWNLLDLAESVARARVPVGFVVVARAGLGTLNHAELTTLAIEQRGLNLHGVVIGSWPADPDVAATQNLRDLPLVTGAPLLGRIPEGAGALSPADFARGVPDWLALPGLTSSGSSLGAFGE